MSPCSPHAGARASDEGRLVEVAEGAGGELAAELPPVLARVDRLEGDLRLEAHAAVDRRVDQHLVDPGRGQCGDGPDGGPALGPDVLELAGQLAAGVGDVPRLLDDVDR